jgi:hypothetical protein
MFAFILDPRAKMRGFHKALLHLLGYNGIDYSSVPQDVRKGFTRLFQVYEPKFGDARLRVHQRHPQLKHKSA